MINMRMCFSFPYVGYPTLMVTTLPIFSCPLPARRLDGWDHARRDQPKYEDDL
jgi:hypothetical protein